MNNYNTKAILKKYRLYLLGVFGVFVATVVNIACTLYQEE